MLTRIGPAIVLASLLLAGCGDNAPDTIIVNGKVFTSNTMQPWAQAIAIRGDRVVGTADTATITAMAGPATRIIDAGGRTIIPGINDAHIHAGPRVAMHEVDAGQDPTPAEIAAAIKSAHHDAPPQRPIIIAFGGRVWDDESITRAWLDAIVKDRPVFLRAFTGHGAIMNSAALAFASLDESTGDPEGGRFQRDASGRLNGRAEEYADELVGRRLRSLVPAEQRPGAYREFSAEAVRLGITSVQLMANGGPHKETVSDIVASGSPLRWRVIRWPSREAGRDIEDSKAHLPPQPAPNVDARGMKWMLDGTPIERLAAVRQPYRDRPEQSGRLNLSPERIAMLAGWAYGSEDPLAVHAVGDRAIETYLEALEKAGHPETWIRKRPRIEHGDMLMPDLIPRAKALGVVVVQNPAHLMLRDELAARIDPERLKFMQPMKSLLAAGVPLALGSDGPLNPFLNILFATTHAVNPSEALTREQAVSAYTVGSAFAEFKEREKGRLVVGSLADLTVLSADVFSVPPPELPKITSLMTMIGGRIVHDTGAVR
ncbi:MAG TPA: amidohydrolase [Vicinamibacterales bacterium]